MTNRLNLIYFFIVIIVILLLSRVFFLSIKSNSYYEELSKNNYIKKVPIVPVRGMIEDRNGEKLAINNLGFYIAIKPHLRGYKRSKELEETIDFIVKNFPQYEKEKLIKEYKKKDSPYNHEYVKIIDYIDYDEFFPKFTIFSANKNIQVDASSKRYYPYKSVAAHVIGYIGKSSRMDNMRNELSEYTGIIGKNGLEKFYNEVLQGEIGFKNVKVNAVNEELEILNVEQPKHTKSLKTTLDIKLQKYIHEVFDKKSGAVIVMDAHNGELLAAASFPEYDNNIFVSGISVKEWNEMRNDFNHPFTNKIINGLYPPGSIIKMGVSLSFLENGIKPDYKVYCDGAIQIGNRNFRCWKQQGHGKVDFRKAIRESCDDFFYKASLKTGINSISETLAKYGFGKPTGVDLNNEFYGINPNKNWKLEKFNEPWYVGETVITSIGQGHMLVSPLQMARYTAFLATEKLPTPHFHKSQYKEPEVIKTNQKHMDLIRKGMYDVTNHPKGTAKYYTRSKVTIAGKTGTAQVIGIPQSEKKRMKESELEYYHRSHAWLTTYGPFKNPKYVVTVMVEHGGHGGSAAGGITSKIYDKLYDLGYITDTK